MNFLIINIFKKLLILVELLRLLEIKIQIFTAWTFVRNKRNAKCIENSKKVIDTVCKNYYNEIQAIIKVFARGMNFVKALCMAI